MLLVVITITVRAQNGSSIENNIAFVQTRRFLYALDGGDNWIPRYSIINNKLVTSDAIKPGEAWNRGKNVPAVSPAGQIK